MWALTVWALLASLAVVVLSAKLWRYVELREQEAVDQPGWPTGLPTG
ncbi:hypothetical protein [Modestobacter sp. URMC 112]